LVAYWWSRWRRANIGVATGAESRIAVVDIDLPTAVASLDRLIEGKHKLPPTLTALTGGGGVHLIYLIYRSRDSELGNSVSRLPGMDEELPGIDLRANGGYIVAPPSVHCSGAQYEWLDEPT
jgi:putative DNA primase/helicase